jgi:hypothetical protein
MPIGNKDQNMNQTLETQKNIKISHQPKLFGLPSPVIGALIGVTLFTLVYLVSNAAGLEFLPTVLLAPGIIAYYNSDLASDFLRYVVVFGISAIPFAILGSLFGSKSKGLIIIGISLFIIYFIVSIAVMGLFILYSSDY